MFKGGRRHTGRGRFALVLETVVDQDDVETLRAELARARIEHRGDLYVDCGSLNYACLDALRVFVAAARVLAAGDRQLVLVELSPYFVEVFRATAWDGTPGLALIGTGTGARRGHADPGSSTDVPPLVSGSPEFRTDPSAASERPAL